MTPPRATRTLHVPSAFAAVGPATEEAEVWLAEQEVSADASYLVSLAIEELVTNCVKYGYDDEATHTIDIVLSVEDGFLRMEVIDDGHAFNPLEAPKPDLALPLSERPLGGLGIHLLRELSDEMLYERRDGTNRLVLTKRMS